MARVKPDPNACKGCGRTAEMVRLTKCVICHAPYCRACGVRRHGKAFCSRMCAEVFFFGTGEETEG